VAGFPSFAHRSILPNSTPSTRPSPPINPSNLLQSHSSSPGKEQTHNSNSLGGSTSPRDGGPPSTPINRDGGIAIGIIGGHSGSRGPSPGMPPSSVHLNSTGHLPPSMQNCQSGMGPDKNPEFFLQIMKNAGCESPGLNYPPPSGSPVGGSPMGGNSPQGTTPSLHEAQIARLAQAASELVANMPSLEPRKDAFTNKRKMSKELEMIMNMSDDDPRRMEEIRKYAAIYGRFDCKRKPEKPLTMHEVSVNEAAAQICKYMPALLTRRDELFPLARQVVRDSGYQYSKGHS
ncbi:NGFI-A-binding-like protein, partial [Armadillidium nasatum]